MVFRNLSNDTWRLGQMLFEIGLVWYNGSIKLLLCEATAVEVFSRIDETY